MPGRKTVIKDLHDGGLLSTADATALQADATLSLNVDNAANTTGADVAVVADVNVVGGLLVAHRILLASGADADVDVLLTHKTRVVDVVIVLKGAGTTGADVQVQNVTTAITDLIDVSSGSDEDVFRPASIDDAQQEIAAAANLRVAYSSTGADFPGAEVTVIGYRVA